MSTAAKVSLLSDVRYAAGFTILARCSGIIDGEEDLRPDDGSGGGGLVLQVDPTAEWLFEVRLQHVLSVEDHFGDVREWRISSIDDGAGEAGGDPVVIRADPLILDLVNWPCRAATAGGVVSYIANPEGTADELLAAWVLDGEIPWLAAGVVESSAVLRPQIADWSKLQLVRWIQSEEGLELPPPSLRADDAAGVYRLDMLRDVGADATPVYARPERNIITLRRTRDREEVRNVVIARGDIAEGETEPATLARMVLEVAEWNSGTRRATLIDPEERTTPVLVFADMFGGSADGPAYYLKLEDGTLVQITDTLPHTQSGSGPVIAITRGRVVLAAGADPYVGELVEIRADAAGGLITELANVPLITELGGLSAGRLAGKITVEGGRGERNEIRNPTLRDWTLVPWDGTGAVPGVFGFVGHRGAAESFGTSVSVEPTVTMPAGAMLLVTARWINRQTSPSFGVDVPVAHEVVFSAPAGGPGSPFAPALALGLHVVRLLEDLETTDPVTVTAPGTDPKAAALEEWTASGEIIDAPGFASAVGNSSTPSVTESGLTADEHLFIGAVVSPAAPGAQDADYTDLPGLSAVTRGFRILTATGDTYNPTLGGSADWAAALVALRTFSPPATVPAGTYIGLTATAQTASTLDLKDLAPGLLIPDGTLVRYASSPDAERVTTGNATVSGAGTVTLTLTASITVSLDVRVRLDILGDLPEGWTRAAATVRYHQREKGGAATGEVDGAQTTRAPLLRGLPAGFVIQQGDRLIINGTTYSSMARVVVDGTGAVRVSLTIPIAGGNPAPSFADSDPVTVESPSVWPENEPMSPNLLILPAQGAGNFIAPEFHVRFTPGLGPMWIAAGITYYGPTMDTGTGGLVPPRLELVRAPSTVLLTVTDATRVIPAWEPVHVTMRSTTSFAVDAPEDLLLRVRGVVSSSNLLFHTGVNTYVRWVMAYQGGDPNALPTEWSHANRLARRAVLELRARRFPARMSLELDDLSAAAADGYIKAEERLTPGGSLLVDVPTLGIVGERLRMLSVRPNVVDPRRTVVEPDTRPRTLTRQLAVE